MAGLCGHEHVVLPILQHTCDRPIACRPSCQGPIGRAAEAQPDLVVLRGCSRMYQRMLCLSPFLPGSVQVPVCARGACLASGLMVRLTLQCSVLRQVLYHAVCAQAEQLSERA